jgi:hypothetical protein
MQPDHTEYVRAALATNAVKEVCSHLEQKARELDDAHAEIERLRNALTGALSWFSDPDADKLEQWERIASEFYEETGYLRPGKSYPLGSYVPDDLDEIWGEWTLRRQRETIANMRAALVVSPPSSGVQSGVQGPSEPGQNEGESA